MIEIEFLLFSLKQLRNSGLFTGHHPFYSTHPSGLYGLRDMLLSDEEVRDPRDLNKDMPESRAKIIRRMLSKETECRYGSIKEAYEDFVDIGLLCAKCSTKNPVNARYCNQCGNSLEEERKDQFKDKTPQELWSKAFQLNGLMKFSEALRFCDEAIRLQSDFSDAHQTKAFALSSLGKYEDAIDSYNEALKYYPDTTRLDRAKLANVWTNMSYCYSNIKKSDLSKKALERAIAYDPNHYKAKKLLEQGFERGYW